MSFVITHRKNTAWRQGWIKRLATDVVVYGSVETTQARAKELRKHVDHLITLGKKNTLASKQEIMSLVCKNKQMDKQDILKKLTTTLAKKYADRKGGYTRVLKLDNRAGDNTKMAIIQLV